jgi:hypothetical protein
MAVTSSEAGSVAATMPRVVVTPVLDQHLSTAPAAERATAAHPVGGTHQTVSVFSSNLSLLGQKFGQAGGSGAAGGSGSFRAASLKLC